MRNGLLCGGDTLAGGSGCNLYILVVFIEESCIRERNVFHFHVVKGPLVKQFDGAIAHDFRR